METLEDLILFIIVVPFLLNAVVYMCIELADQYVDWKLECKRMLLSADDDYCMCGDRIDAHHEYGGHAPLSEYEWAIKNLPELKLG